MKDALFVVSTGRCGTQWLASVLERLFGDSAVVEHEPLDHDYAMRDMLAARDPHRLDPGHAEPLLDHIAMIEEVLETKPYIECGHPNWSTIPYLVERFAGRVKLVHLVRHPVPTALSWLTHYAYCPPASAHLPMRVLVSPFDEGVRHPEYRERWESMTPYEKALYYWLEVNALGAEMVDRGDVPSITVRYEDLFRGLALERLLAFANAPDVARDVPAADEHVDRFRFFSPVWNDLGAIADHPAVVALAERLGYDALDFDEEKLQRRYLNASP